MKDNIIFWLDGDISYFGLAKYLQAHYDCNLFAIMDIVDKPKRFFQQQQIVQFKKIWFYHDHIVKSDKKTDLEYLSSFEEKYKINLWLLAYNERLFYGFNRYYKFSSDEILSILEQECKLFETVLDETKPDFLIMAQTNLHHNHLFHELCKARGIKVLMLGPARFGYRCTISTDADKIDAEDEQIVNKTEQQTWDDLQKYLQRFDSFKNASDWKKRFLTSKSRQIGSAIKYFFSTNTNIRTHYTYYGRTKFRVLFKELIFLLKKKYRSYFIDKNLNNKINDNKPFIYFPLHEEPESALLISAPFYTNQLEVITQIVKSLPAGYDLYVKDHFIMSARGWRKISFYKQIMSLPNVKLLHPSTPPKNILEKCSLVITIGGTSGLEAALNKKPSIIFTDMSYAILPSVHRIKTMDELPTAINLSLKKVVNPKDIIDYALYVEANSFEFDVIGMGLDYNDHFYFGGFLVDVDITEEQMNSFFANHNSEFEKLALEHVKRINHHKKIKQN